MNARIAWTGLFFLLVGCGGGNFGQPPDGDAGEEATADGGADAGGDLPPADGGTDAGPDAGGDPGVSECTPLGELPLQPKGQLRIGSSCPLPADCAGGPEGSWKYSEACADPADLFQRVYAVCSAATYSSPTSRSISGTATLEGGIFSRNFQIGVTAQFSMPNACHGCRCADLEASLIANGVSANCNPTCSGGVCTCSVTVSVNLDRSESYTDDGRVITTQGGQTFTYCAGSNTLALQETISGDDAGTYFLVADHPGPFPEVCDGRDNDGDGSTDEAAVDCPDCLRAGVCAAGSAPVCRGEGGWLCNYLSADYEIREVTCDRLDNDCDGETDEAAPCGPEVCDGVDNDGNGLVDDDPTDVPPDCLTGGVCADGSAQVCTGAAGWVCQYASGDFEPDEASCDFLDNDCDGQTDEMAYCGPEVCDGRDNDGSGVADDNLTDTPNCLNAGVCAEGSSAQCLGAAGWECRYASADYEAEETSCDGRDNDCDGKTDEPFDCCDPALRACTIHLVYIDPMFPALGTAGYGKLYHASKPGDAPWQFEILDRGLASYGSQRTDFVTELALDDDGHPQVVWYVGTTSSSMLAYKYFDGLVWHQETVTSRNPELGGSKNFLLVAGGIPHLVYRSNFNLVYASRASGSWSEEIAIDFGAGSPGYRPALSIDTSGYAHISHHRTSPLRYCHQTPTGWLDEELSTPDASGGIKFITVDTNGHPHIVFPQGYTRWNGSAWVRADGTPGHDAFSAGQVSPARTPGGDILLGEIVDNRLILRHKALGDTAWGPPQEVFSATVVSEAAIAADVQENPHIVVAAGEPGKIDIFYVRWELGQWVSELVAEAEADLSAGGQRKLQMPSIALH